MSFLCIPKRKKVDGWLLTSFTLVCTACEPWQAVPPKTFENAHKKPSLPAIVLYNTEGETRKIERDRLWHTALDHVQEYPLLIADYAGGVISTDWKQIPNTPNERIKITLRLTDTTSNPEERLQIRILRQQQNNGQWQDQPLNEVQQNQAQSLKIKILQASQFLSTTPP